MKKLLRPKDVMLLGLAGALDIYEEIRDPMGLGAEAAKNLYGWVPRRYKRHNFRRIIQRGLKTGEIEKVVKNGEAYLSLTSYGKRRVVREFPILSLQSKRWDGKWRVVIFDIAEITRGTRNNLRNKLRQLGFGMLQESVYISPHDFAEDFKEFVDASELEDYVFVVETSRVLVGNAGILINRIWHLDRINEKYKKLLEVIGHFYSWYVSLDDRRSKHTTIVEGKPLREIAKKIGELREKYLEILLIDPMLPRELLPKDWPGEKVRREIKKLPNEF